jgi:hypothetical protein
VASLEALERLRRPGWREQLELVEHKPPTERVTPVDIVRVDGLNRHVVVVPAGTAPPHWVQLTEQERQALVEPPQSLPDGWLEPGHAGFTPKNTVVGRWTIKHLD